MEEVGAACDDETYDNHPWNVGEGSVVYDASYQHVLGCNLVGVEEVDASYRTISEVEGTTLRQVVDIINSKQVFIAKAATAKHSQNTVMAINVKVISTSKVLFI